MVQQTLRPVEIHDRYVYMWVYTHTLMEMEREREMYINKPYPNI